MPQGISADLIATKYGFSRDDVDAYAVESQKRAAKSWEDGHFKKSVVPVKDVNGLTILDQDEHMRPTTTMQTLAALQPSFVQMGEMAGFDAVAVQRYPEVESDQSRASRRQFVRHRRRRRRRADRQQGSRQRSRPEAARAHQGLRQYRLGAGDHADRPGRRDARRCCKKAGMTLNDIDLFELNEAFASVVLRYMQAFDIPHDKINVNGGAIAMGHPLGATGAMILGTVLDELERAGNYRPRWSRSASAPAWAPRRSSSGS